MIIENKADDIKYHSIITYSNSLETYSKLDFYNEKICLAFSLFVVEKNVNICLRGFKIEVIKTTRLNNSVSTKTVRIIEYYNYYNNNIHLIKNLITNLI